MNETSTQPRGGSGRNDDGDAAPRPAEHAGVAGPQMPAHADAQVAKALATLSAYEDWAHRPIPPVVEKAVLELDAQELMTTAAVCLLRLTRRDEHDAA